MEIYLLFPIKAKRHYIFRHAIICDGGLIFLLKFGRLATMICGRDQALWYMMPEHVSCRLFYGEVRLMVVHRYMRLQVLAIFNH